MLAELPIAALTSFNDRLAEQPAALAASSIAAGNTSGRLWAGDETPATASIVLWDQGNNLLYIAIAPDDSDALRELLDNQIRKAARDARLEHVGLRALDTGSEHRLPELLALSIHGQRRMMFWQAPLGHKVAMHPLALAGVRWEPIEPELLARDDLAGLDEVRQEIGWMWPSLERFEQHGFGVAALMENQLICWCTAEYVGPERCGIGIATSEAFRGYGIATATAALFVRNALDRGLTPCWECGADNTASARVAAKLGFELLLEYNTWLVEMMNNDC